MNNKYPEYQSEEKLKFINNERIFGDQYIMKRPGLFPSSTVGKLEYSNVESLLTRPTIQNSLRKDYVKEIDCCKTHCEPNYHNTNSNTKYDFDDMMTYERRKDLACYKRPGDRSAGRGMGNVYVASYLQYGQDSRNDLDTITGVELDKYKFHYHFRNYQDPNHLVFPLPRGGIDTRNLDKYTKIDNY